MTMTTSSAFDGTGTFYGDGGHGAEGACMLPVGFNGIEQTVAINHDQWEGGMVCGRCVMIYPLETSAVENTFNNGPFKATIDNLCPECSHGDIDIAMSIPALWRIKWEFVDC